MTIRLGNKRRILAAAMALAMSGTTAWAAESQADSTQSLQGQIQDLKTRIDQLQQEQQTQQNAHPSTATQVDQDAANSSKPPLQSAFEAGYSHGKFIIQSTDGTFTLHPNFQFQFRNSTDYRRDATAGGGDQTDNGFELRRMKFGFEGTAYDKNLHYFFSMGNRPKQRQSPTRRWMGPLPFQSRAAR